MQEFRSVTTSDWTRETKRSRTGLNPVPPILRFREVEEMEDAETMHRDKSVY